MRTIGLLTVLSWAVLLVDQVFCQAPQDTLDKDTQTISTTPATSPGFQQSRLAHGPPDPSVAYCAEVLS